MTSLPASTSLPSRLFNWSLMAAPFSVSAASVSVVETVVDSAVAAMVWDVVAVSGSPASAAVAFSVRLSVPLKPFRQKTQAAELGSGDSTGFAAQVLRGG